MSSEDLLKRSVHTIGLVADPQVGDLDDFYNDEYNVIKYFRKGYEKLEAVIEAMNTPENDEPFLESKLPTPKIDALINLGDIIEGNSTPERTQADLSKILSIFGKLNDDIPLYHVVGNHCLAQPRETVLSQLGIVSGQEMHAYYRINLQIPGYMLLVLDSMDVSLNGSTEANVAQAQVWLETHADVAVTPNAMTWNGKIGETQQEWMKNQFAIAREQNLNVVLFNHIPLLPAASTAMHVLWNWEEITTLLEHEKHQLGTRIQAFINGHCHMGGYAERKGIHHVTVHGQIESPEDGNAYGYLQLHPDRMELLGVGTVPSRTLAFS